MNYVKAEREAYFPLRTKAVIDMSPYLFTAGHANYARYGHYQHLSMQLMSYDMRKFFKQGDHKMHHVPDLFNGEWSGMALETTWKERGKFSDDLIVGNTNLKIQLRHIHTVWMITSALTMVSDK